ncbi:electron transfer flavoprotein subunit alpha [mine drainage metagenome]|uniref:Electron transfer flavoprotein subunit alpha n=1 Tax=mine drainage metagenome TaxID=410659 RepID=A0A1J5SZR5_9ZZZZ
MSTLLIAEHDNAGLKVSTRNTLTAAAKLGSEVDILIAGHNCKAAAQAAATLAGVRKVLVADAAHLADGLAENLANLTVQVVKAGGYSHVLTPATTFGKNFLPRVAAMLDVAQISDIVSVVDPNTFVRPIYAGNALCTVESRDSIKVISVRPSAFEGAGDGGSATVEAVTPPADTGTTTLVGRELSVSARPELGAAKVIVSGGRGLGSGDNYRQLLEPLADKLGAALGASRAAVDAGFVPNDFQVGQTGKIVAPQLYIAVGISGAIQHLAGMKESKVIVAINKDPDAPIFQVADYGLVADLFEAVPQLTASI